MKIYVILAMLFLIACTTKEVSSHVEFDEVPLEADDFIVSDEKDSTLSIQYSKLSLKLTFRRPYCSGAYMTEDELNEFRRITPYSNSIFRVFNLDLDTVIFVKSDNNGVITEMLPKGKYLLKLSDSKNEQLELPYFENCLQVLNKSWNTFTLEGDSLYSHYTFNFTCGNPCDESSKMTPKP